MALVFFFWCVFVVWGFLGGWEISKVFLLFVSCFGMFLGRMGTVEGGKKRTDENQEGRRNRKNNGHRTRNSEGMTANECHFPNCRHM